MQDKFFGKFIVLSLIFLFIGMSINSSTTDTPEHTIMLSDQGKTTNHSYSNNGNHRIKSTVINDYSTMDVDTTKTCKNNPPYLPSNPNPEDGAIDVNTDVDLSWTGGDPDSGDTVTYDVYFGSMPPFEKVANNISVTTYNSSNLGNGLTYYWNIVAWDNHGASTEGPGWHFTTVENQLPEYPVINGSSKGKPGIEYVYCITVSDPDGDDLYVKWDWGDGIGSDWLGPFESGIDVCDSHTWKERGTFTISVTVKDEHGVSVTAYKEVTMPRNRIATNSHFFNFLEEYYNLFSILKHLLNLLS